MIWTFKKLKISNLYREQGLKGQIHQTLNFTCFLMINMSKNGKCQFLSLN